MAQHTAPPRYGPAARSGLVTFAGILLVIAGSFNLLDGVVALAKDDRFRVEQLLFGDLSAWGIWWLVIGILLLYAGWQVLQRKDIGMMLGIGFAGLNAFTQLMFIGAYPAWSISIMVLDLIVIYALSAHSTEFE
jgi:hypothetical protein